MDKARISDLFSRAAAIFFPERCVLCARVVEYDDLCCKKCAAVPFGAVTLEHLPHPPEAALAACEYKDAVRDAILRLKDRPEKRTFLFFARLIQGEIEAAWKDVRFDLLVPVPVNPKKRKERGFNQAEGLARCLGGLLRIPVAPDVLIRHDTALVQRTLTRDERRLNAAQSYASSGCGDVRGKTLLLVDDVFTTGATVSACTAALTAAGAKRVYAVTATAVREKTESVTKAADRA